MRRLVRIVMSLVPCAGCASMATQASAVRATMPYGDVSTRDLRRVFTSHLGSVRDSLDGDAPTDRRCWGTVRLVLNDDDTLEYLITIHNPGGETFTAAHLERGVADDQGSSVATLFSEVTLGERYVQLRGTVQVNRDRSPGVLAEEIRERPGDFVVTVASRSNPRGVIVGTVE